MNIPTKYGFGSTPKADNKIRIKGSTDYILLLCVILLVAIGIALVRSRFRSNVFMLSILL